MRRRSTTYGPGVPSPAGSRWHYVGIALLVLAAALVVVLALRPRAVPSPATDGVDVTPSAAASLSLH